MLRSAEQMRTYLNNQANTAALGTAAVMVDSSSDTDVEIASAPSRQFEQDPSHTMSPGDEDEEDDSIRSRTLGTISIREVIPPHPSETGDHYFARFESNWERGLDREGLVRNITQATPISGANSKRSRGSADEEPPLRPDKVPPHEGFWIM